MPHEISLEMLPAGISLHAARGGETIAVQFKGVATSEDGELMIRYLSFADDLLSKVAASGVKIRQSQIDTLAAILRADRTATVWINELELITTCRPARSIRKGEPLFKDDIIDISDARFKGIEVPNDAGVLLICSSGWRKGVFFDFGPLNQSEQVVRDYELWRVLGQIVARLFFQERFAISNQDWAALLAARWFPFAGLSNKSIEDLLTHVRAGWGVTELLPAFRDELMEKVDRFIESWKSNAAFQNHMQLLSQSVERFKAADYLSCASIVYPRIEGLLRSHHISAAIPGGRGQMALTESAVSSLVENPYSLLLPQRFQEYLQTCIFASFDEDAGAIPFSRNSVSHGIAAESEFNLESAVIALLVCHQLFYCFPAARDAADNKT